MRPEVTIDGLRVRAYTVPTDEPESDGTFEWDATTIVVVEADGGGRIGLGYTYTDESAATLIRGRLAEVVEGRDALAVHDAWTVMVRAIRNLGRPGIASTAISAVDIALWDLKTRLLEMPLATLLDRTHDRIPVYGSGGFTSYSDQRLREQLGAWAANGIRMVKMKVGREPERDVARVGMARDAIGPDVELFVDANGAYGRKRALSFAAAFGELDVRWFEEPVTSDDLEGLRLLRDRGPGGMDIAAGEYGYDLPYFARMLEADAVDCLQADVTRCGGITGFLQVGALCEARSIDLSAHCAPAASLPACLAVARPRHIEYFHDHVRIERLLFDGGPTLRDGELASDLSRPGLGVELKRADAERFAA
ncbi:MAG TPA: enolase C-terminal domain-like protein [Actinomycetota bacterium]|nr:enolase C-terminal domain-like protein [Actinomycetota bacterium]